MNILFISEKSSFSKSSYGGAESSMTLMAQKLLDLNHEIIYLHRERKSNIKQTSIPSKLKVYNAPYLRGSSKLKILNHFNKWMVKNKLKKINKASKIDIIYGFYEVQLIESALEFRNKYNQDAKVILRMAGLSWTESILNNYISKKRYEKLFNSVDAINYIHQELKKKCYEYYKLLNMNVNPRFEFSLDIGLEIQETKKQKVYPRKKLKILMATRFSNYQKRQDLLIEAMNKISDSTNIELLLIGDGPNLDNMKDLVKDNNLEQKVTFLSFQNQIEIWNIIEDYDLLVHSTNYEGLSKIIIESMNLGTPVLASDVTPMNSYIKDSENGFLVKNTADEWAKKLDFIYQNQKILRQISINSHKFVYENYNCNMQINEFIKKFLKIKGIDYA